MIRLAPAGVRAAGAASAAMLALAACGGGSSTPGSAQTSSAPAAQTASAPAVRTGSVSSTATVARPKPKPRPPAYPQLLPAALGSRPTQLAPAIRWKGQTAAWVERLGSGAAVVVLDQRLLELHLHSGTIDAGRLGRYGPSVGGAELTRLAAAFNGGFRLSTGAGGFEADGHVAVPLRAALASIVTYADGTTDIGSWHEEVPAPGKPVVSVRQNLSLLIDHGVAASNVGCLLCWGATLGGVVDPARAGLGITSDGRLVWAAGENLTVSQLAQALLGARAVRAEELDINPEWVAGYFYVHRGGHGPPSAVPALPSQHGIPREFLAPWSRDFFSVVAR